MNPLAALLLLSVNLLTFILSLSVLMLALWQNPGTPTGRALNTFLGSLVFLNLTVVLVLVNELFLGASPSLTQIAGNASIIAFSLTTLTAFALIITAAGMMKQALQVISRAGIVYLVLMQWPLWNEQLFQSPSTAMNAMTAYAQAGLVGAAVNLAYVLLGLAAVWAYRRRVEPALLISISVLFVGQGLTLLLSSLRVILFPSLLTSIVGSILGYSMVRLQLFNPLMMRTAQLAAVRDLSQAMTIQQDLQQVLRAVAKQTRLLLKTGIALILLVDEEGQLVVVAQDGGSIPLTGRKLAPGEGLAGRVLQTQQVMSLANYRTWEGRSEAFADQNFYASLSVPLIDGEDTVGVLNVHELEPGRIYSERDRAVVEMLVSQASLGITHARLHQEVAYWREHGQMTESAPPVIRFDERGQLIQAELRALPFRAQPPQIVANPNGNTVSELILKVLQDYPLKKRALSIQIAPGTVALSLPLPTLYKVIRGALDQVIERAAEDDRITIDAHPEDDALLIEVSRYPNHTEHGQEYNQAADRVRIRLENDPNGSI